MMNNDIVNKNIDPSMFEFVQSEGQIHDKKLDTKPIGYFKDAFIRFKRNRSSVVSFVIIVILMLFAIFGPVISSHTTTETDGFYCLSLPKSTLFSWAGWDGASIKNVSQDGYDKLKAISYEALDENAKNKNTNPILKDYGTTTDALGNISYKLYVDSYYSVGYTYQILEAYDYFALQAYQNDTDLQIIYPISANYYADTNANTWYKTTEYAKACYYQLKLDQSQIFSTFAELDENGNYIPNYLGTAKIDKADYYSDMRLKGEVDPETKQGNYTYISYSKSDVRFNSQTGEYVIKGSKENNNYYYQYAVQNQTGYKVRVTYYEFYKFNNTTKSYPGGKDAFQADYTAAEAIENNTLRAEAMNKIINKFEFKNDGKYCTYLFGSNDKGKDIFVMLSSGARLSFILAIVVSLINLTIGAIYGSIEGYFGGAADLIMERVSDILSEVPFIVVATLFSLHLAEKVGAVVSLLFAFVLTGWIGTASRTRMQFYRFKGQEYVLSARTLGAKDARIMFKHIFPNAIGTLITSSVLSIPGVIFSESSLSYLHIINLETSGYTSVGTLLSNGTSYTNTYPHVVFFPAMFIALLMISFNLLGNGLRDAFNPALRGVEE